MEKACFSSVLQALRKEKKMTQESLAAQLGVSAQAVSKWENGSYPEGDLIPKIAEIFNVSIDYLYGRVGRDISIEQQVMNCLLKTAKEETEKTHDSYTHEQYFEQMLRILWAAQISIWENNKDYYERPKSEEGMPSMASVIHDNAGYAFMNLEAGREYYFLLKDPQNSGYESWIKGNKKIYDLFKILSDEENVDVLAYLYSLGAGEFASIETIADALKLNRDKVQKLVEHMVESFNENNPNGPIVDVNIIGKDGKPVKVYGISMNLGGLLMAIFGIANTYIKSPCGFAMQIGCREKPMTKREQIVRKGE